MNKKERLIQAATALIREQGYEKTSVSQIVKRAGVAQGTYYLYFQKKSDLVTEIAAGILQHQLTRIQANTEEQNLTGVIRTIIEVSFDTTRENRDLVTFLYSGFAYDDRFEMWERIYRPYYEWLANCLPASTPYSGKEELARLIIGLIEHASESYYLSNQQQTDVETAKENVRLMIMRALPDSE
ncbi:TetR family transcriptional regulator [Salisediminibacterium beveridgei]|uniref:Transcriptional regulator, TetR family n=1 Tax=Salisediminibacterium beveridgei TaxID=632773 RepID=A0A1D7QXS1_9BACI|nr:TetR family transcriptional regulator [Salisediminibacterium beveridgei]AOM83802.1 Transcriptional regulator, TetR family [Salisediminibacterium beveridgei]